MRHHASDLLQHGRGKRVFEGKPLAFHLGFLVKVAMNCPFEETGPFRHPRHFIIQDQRCRAVHAFYLLHRVVTEMGLPVGAAPPLQAGRGAADAQPVRQAAAVFCFVRQWFVRRQRIIRRHHGNRVAGAQVWIDDLPVVPDTETGQHG